MLRRLTRNFTQGISNLPPSFLTQNEPRRSESRRVDNRIERLREIAVPSDPQQAPSRHFLWNRTFQNSMDYINTLELTKDEIDDLEHLQYTRREHLSQLKSPYFEGWPFQVEGKQFILGIRHTYAGPYGGDWTKTIQVASKSYPFLNHHTGMGTCFINAIPEKWHKKILGVFQKKKEAFRSYIHLETIKNKALWKRLINHSKTYSESLWLSKSDVGMLKNLQLLNPSLFTRINKLGVYGLPFSIDGEDFILYARSTCGAPYGSKWKTTLQVASISNPRLNTSRGIGTSSINIVSEEWHNKIAATFREYRHLVQPLLDHTTTVSTSTMRESLDCQVKN